MIDLAMMLVASCAIIVAALGGSRLLRTPADSALEHVMVVGLLLIVGVLGVSLVAGVPGFYRPLPLLVGSLVALVPALLGRFQPPRRPRPRARARARAASSARSVAGLARRNPLAAAAVVLAGVALLNRALMALLLQPGRFDELAYHLVFVGDWVQRGSLGGSELQRATCCAWYPVNAEITYAWLAVFVHSDRLVGLGQVGFLAVGGVATASIARSVGAPGRYAIVAGSLFVLTPVALRQASTNMVDVALAAGVLVTVAFALRILVVPGGARTADVVRFSLAAAVTLGIKASAIPYVVAACVVLAGHALLERQRATARPPLRSVVAAAAVVVAFVGLGSGWYVRAWVETGNPVWPYRVAVAEREIFAGTHDPRDANTPPPTLAHLPGALHAPRSWLHDLDVDLSLRRDPYDPNGRLGGLGLVWLFVGIPAAVAALAVSVRRREWLFPLFAAMVAPIAILSVPDPWYARFVIPLAAVGLVAYAHVAGLRPGRAAQGLTVVALSLSVIGVIETRPLAGMERVLNTPGAPLERPPSVLDERGYWPLHELPARARVGVVAGNPMLPYLTLGGQFSRDVVVVRRRPESAEELRRWVRDHDLDYLVTRAVLPPAVLRGAGLALLAEASGGVVYRRDVRAHDSESGEA